MLNYPMTYEGGSQFLTDRFNDGTITANHRQIIEAQINALLNATSEAEVLNILNVVNEELSTSQLSPTEVSSITEMNSAIEAMVEFDEVMAYNGNYNNIFQKTGAPGAIIGLSLIAIGLTMMWIGTDLGESVAGAGLLVLTGFVIDAWGRQ